MADMIEYKVNPAWRGDKLPRSLWADTTRVLNDGGADIVRIAQRIAPFRSGDLISTIRHEVDQGPAGPSLRIIAGGLHGTGEPSLRQGGDGFVDYARYVEEGTRRAPKQPFMVPALEQAARLGRFG